MFADTAEVFVAAGDGGNGALAFVTKNMLIKVAQMVVTVVEVGMLSLLLTTM